jgi:hypothetical protein
MRPGLSSGEPLTTPGGQGAGDSQGGNGVDRCRRRAGGVLDSFCDAIMLI